LRYDPRALLGQIFRNTWAHARSDAGQLLGIATTSCVLVGAIVIARDRERHRLWPVLIAGAMAYVCLVPANYSERYSLPLLPIYATISATVFVTSSKNSRRGGRIRPVLLAVPIAFSLFDSIRTQSYVLAHLPREVMVCSRVIRAAPRGIDDGVI